MRKVRSSQRAAAPMRRALLLATALAAPAAGQVFPGELFQTHGDPTRVELADMDADGDLDVVLLTQGLRIEVQLNDGQGRFTSSTNLIASGDFLPVDLALGDLDEDGAIDAVTVSSTSGAVNVLLGDGAGGLAAPVHTDAGGAAQRLVLGDMNGDGHLDVVVLAPIGEGVTVLLGDGAGGLPTTMVFAVQTSDGRLALGDVDGDGDLDVAVPSSSFGTTLPILLNDGAGQLAAPVFVELGEGAGDLAAGDVDGDGRAEIVASRSPLVAVLVQSDGMGGFLVGSLPASLPDPLLTDIDGDGDLDLLSHDFQGSVRAPWLLAGHGDGSFDAPLAMGPLQTWPFTYAPGELDGDGEADLLVAHDDASALSVVRADGAGSFVQPPFVDTPNSAYLRDGADFDQDGETDLVLLDDSQNQVVVMFGLGGGAFAPALSYSVGGRPKDVAIADLDGDGSLDILTADHDSDSVAFLRYVGSRRFVLADQFGVGAGLGPSDLALADLDADGLLDLVVAGFEGVALGVRMGTGGGGLGPLTLVPLPITPRDLDLADVDEDGAPDVILNGSLPSPQFFSRIAVLRGDGAGGFGAAQLISALIGQQVLGDVNEDGLLDIVIKNTGSSGIYIVGLGDGGGGFSMSVAQAISTDYVGPGLADVTGDGHLDLILTRPTEHSVAVLPGDGTGRFDGLRRFLCGGTAATWALADDFDDDGRPDLYVQALGEIRVLRNLTDPFVWAPVGAGLAGSAGTPSLGGQGELLPGSSVLLRMDGMLPGSSAALILGLSTLGAPFKGGTLVPFPHLVLAGLPTGPDGFLTLGGTWPVAASTGVQLWFQAWIVDPAGPVGLSASNGLRATAP